MLSGFHNGLFCNPWQPLLRSVRGARRVNVGKPRAPHYERAKVLELIKPMFPRPIEDSLPPADKCLKKIELLQDKYRIDNPYERILAKEILNWCNHSKLIAIVHTNPIKGEDEFMARILLKRENMTSKKYSRFTVEIAFDGTIYSPLLCLFNVHQIMIFCDEPKVRSLLKIIKKIPQYILLGAVVEGRLLSVSQLVAYSKLDDLTSARAQLAATLQSGPSALTTRLNQHQSSLINLLNAHKDNLSKQSS